MRAYLYDLETGLYQGETFEYEEIIDSGEGITRVAPPEHKSGYLALFVRNSGTWRVVTVESYRQMFVPQT
ncbi:MAG: hypothetical protein HXX17_00605 [Geobacteraceae bacterium]|nr:hypothetical protein [Geobacteraceae bacterium]